MATRLVTTWQRALVLLAGFGAAKLALVALRVIDGGGRTLGTAWAPVAMVYQDVWVAGLFVGLDAALSTRRSKSIDGALWAAVAVLVGYSAFNVVIARVFSTPLTISMLGAAGGALSDSMLAYVTPANVLAILAVVGVAGSAARAVGRPPEPRRAGLCALALALVALVGPTAAARVETLGLHRNAWVALGGTWLARHRPPPPTPGTLASLAEEGPALDLTHLLGAARGRNVVWVILESTAAQYLGTYGGAPDPTPHLTRLSENALVVDSAYAVHPESIKGLFSMLCSVAPAAQTTAADYVAARVPCPSMASLLAPSGYRSGFFHSGRFRYLGMQGILDGRGFHELHDAETVGGEHAVSFGTDDASTVRRLLAFVDGLPREQKFFAVYSPISGHHPYKSPGVGPRPFPAKTEREHYLNDLYAGDAAFGELVDGLERRGLRERTLFVVVGDHGEAFQQHEGNFAHTLFLYDENVRVPMIVSAPGITVGRVRVPQVASLLDMAPTTLALLGEPIPSRMQGRSLLLAEPGVARFYTDHGPLKLGLRHGRYKLVHETEHDRSRLFDLTRDPAEQDDLAAREPERVALYRRHLLEWSSAERARIAHFE